MNYPVIPRIIVRLVSEGCQLPNYAVYLHNTVTVITSVGPSPKSLNGVQLQFTCFTPSLKDVVITENSLPIVSLTKLSWSLQNRYLAGGLAFELHVMLKDAFTTTGLPPKEVLRCVSIGWQSKLKEKSCKYNLCTSNLYHHVDMSCASIL